MSDAEQLAIFDKLNDDSKLALLFARRAVTQHGGITVGVEHLAIGVLQVLETTVASILEPGTSMQQLVEELAGNIPASTRPEEADEIQMDRQLWNLLERAAQRAAAAGAPTASPNVLLLAIVEGPDASTRDVLGKAGVTPEAVRGLTIQ